MGPDWADAESILSFLAPFTGGITNSGTLLAPGGVIIVSQFGTFQGGIANSGLLAVGPGGGTAIGVFGGATFAGGISNGGTIVAGNGIAVGCGFCGPISLVSGDITNSGAIAATNSEILVSAVATFAGAIRNSGTVSAGGFAAIAVSSVNVFGSTSAGGGVVNSGMLVASTGIGVAVRNVATFLGGITNAGAIVALGTSGDGIQINNVSTFSGGVINAGTIAAGFLGITIRGPTNLGVPVGSFGGGITNAGLISLGQNLSSAAISVDNLSLFTGGVLNSGTITNAGTGIALGLCGCGISTFMGGVTNSGLISAQLGILVGNVATFSGGITNTGNIAGGNDGIVVAGASFVGGNIVNSGTISGSAAAIDLSAAMNAITIDQTAGLIFGDILLSPFGDTLNVTGGTINGNVTGQSNGDTVNFSLGSGTFTYAAPFAMGGLSQVNFNSGTVFVDGTIQATTIAVNGGGTAAGTGLLVGDVTVMSGGTLMPGDQANPLGTINVVGSLTFNAGSTYAVHITPSANSATSVVGAPASVTINGGTVVVTPQFGHYNATSYTMVDATGPVSGTFSGLTFAGCRLHGLGIAQLRPQRRLPEYRQRLRHLLGLRRKPEPAERHQRHQQLHPQRRHAAGQLPEPRQPVGPGVPQRAHPALGREQRRLLPGRVPGRQLVPQPDGQPVPRRPLRQQRRVRRRDGLCRPRSRLPCRRPPPRSHRQCP